MTHNENQTADDESRLPAIVPAGKRVKLTHHTLTLDDGFHVGVSIAGAGVPLLFLHGIGMNRRAYIRLLSRLPQLGFLVVAIDAPGHGDTDPLPREFDTFVSRVAIASRVLDSLGIRRAVMTGHSMGGRTAVELAALNPDRALAVLMIDPALGSIFDSSTVRISSPVKTSFALASAIRDTISDRVGLRKGDRRRLAFVMSKLAWNTVSHPMTFMSAASAIAESQASEVALRKLGNSGVPSAIIHGERDLIVPLESAVDAARKSRATLVTLPRAYHSWVLSSPYTVIVIMRELLRNGRLGTAIDRAAASVWSPKGTAHPDSPYSPHAAVLAMQPPIEVIGYAEPRSQRLFHRYRYRAVGSTDR